MQDTSRAYAECVIYRLHPLAVTLCKIIVEGEYSDIVTVFRHIACGKCGAKRLALARFHLGDPALCKLCGGGKLFVIRDKTEIFLACDSAGGEYLIHIRAVFKLVYCADLGE